MEEKRQFDMLNKIQTTEIRLNKIQIWFIARGAITCHYLYRTFVIQHDRQVTPAHPVAVVAFPRTSGGAPSSRATPNDTPD
jgi:hypothetical protein